MSVGARENYQAKVVGGTLAGLLQDMSQWADAVIHPVWDRVLPEVAAKRCVKRRGCVRIPRVKVERLARLMEVTLHPALLAWGYSSDAEWAEEVECFRVCLFCIAVCDGPAKLVAESEGAVC